MKGFTIRIGQRVINLLAVRDARRDGRRVWLNYIGGGFAVVDGELADLVWGMLVDSATDMGAAGGKVTTHD